MINRYQKIIDEAFLSCYRKLYAQSTPKGDFDQLMETAKINSRGEKEIPYLDYEIDHDLLESIIQESIKGFKLPKKYHVGFRNGILLGCSPKSKYK